MVSASKIPCGGTLPAYFRFTSHPPRKLYTVTVVLAVVLIGKDVVFWIRTFTRSHGRTALWGDVVLLCLPQESLGKILRMT